MKSFFGGQTTVSSSITATVASAEQAPSVGVDIPRDLLGRIAVYDSLSAAPLCEDVIATDASAFIETLAARVHNLAHERGGGVPYTLVREVVENFIHARFREIVVTILDEGETIRFSDQGPGIPDKDKAFVPGFSTATREMKQVIRGVGSGLPLVREWTTLSEGSISIEDNLGSGTVVTVTIRAPRAEHAPEVPQAAESSVEPEPVGPRLSLRQKRVLSLVMELGSVGPSIVAKELGVAPSTAYRDLAFLQSAGLIGTDGSGRRALTEDGVAALDEMFK